MNQAKTDLKVFNPITSIPFHIEYERIQIEPSSSINLLGVKVGNNLELNSFAVKKIQTCNYHLRNLFHIRKSIPHQARITLVTNLIISNLDYCNSLFTLANKKIIQSMQSVLNKSMRFIFNLSYRSPTSKYLKKIHILPIKFRIKFKICLMGYKIFYNLSPEYLQDHFKQYLPTTTIGLRNYSGRDNKMFNVTVSEMRQNTIFSHIKTNWNSLAFTLREQTSISIFKTQLKTALFKEAFEFVEDI